MRGESGWMMGGGSGIQLMDYFHDAVNGDAIHFEKLLVGCALTELILDADLADARPPSRATTCETPAPRLCMIVWSSTVTVIARVFSTSL